MKNLILLFTFFFSILNAQKIETIKPVKEIGKLNGINLTLSESNKYILCFNNTQYSTITDIKCVNLGDEIFLNEFYKTLSDNFKKETPEDFRIQLSENKIEAKFVKSIGMKFFYFILYDNLAGFSTSTYLTQKKLDRLFGKSK